MSEQDRGADELDRAAAQRDLRAAVEAGLADDEQRSDAERRAANDERSAREAAAADRLAAAAERHAAEERDSGGSDGDRPPPGQ